MPGLLSPSCLRWRWPAAAAATSRPSSSARPANVEVATLEVRISSEILDGGEDGVSDLPEVTQSYIEMLRRNRKILGDEEVGRRLADTASQVAHWCGECERALERELQLQD